MVVDLEHEPRFQRRGDLADRSPLAGPLRVQGARGQPGLTMDDVEAQVVAALGLGQFSLLYQPRFSLRTGDVVAVEALLRWEDAARRLIRPKAFLPLVSHTSAMVALGRWALDEACREAVGWELTRPAGAPPLTLSMNVAAQEVLEPEFLAGVRLILDERGLPANLLQLELDASDPLRGETLVAARLRILRDAGVRVAIDGACPQLGIGSPSVEADSVHLDRRWVRSVSCDDRLAASVAALVDRVHRSGGTVCATGVEAQTQSDALDAAGCDHGQGYFYCHPVPSDALGWLSA